MDPQHHTSSPQMSAPRKWGMSPLDWRAHAIDEQAQHPYGLYIARCGHQLLAITVLHENPPSRTCQACAYWSSQ